MHGSLNVKEEIVLWLYIAVYCEGNLTCSLVRYSHKKCLSLVCISVYNSMSLCVCMPLYTHVTLQGFFFSEKK
jgi:hypothetical protein